MRILLHKKCPYLEFSWSMFFLIQTEYKDLQSKSTYSVRMRKNADQKNSEYGNLSRSVIFYNHYQRNFFYGSFT